MNQQHIENKACYYYSKEVLKQGSISERIDLCELDGEMYDLIGLSDEFKEIYMPTSGGTTIFFSKATIDSSKIIIDKNTKPEIIGKSQIKADYSSFVGNKTVLAIKINAADTNTTSDADRISNKLFGTSGDSVNLKSQISECSMNQLNFLPFNGTTPNGEIILNGVGSVDLPFDLKNKFDKNQQRYINKILNAIRQKYGNLKGDVDHLLLILPKRATKDVAFAYLNWWISYYDDDHVLYPSVTMHEIAHNMGFDHSSYKGREYGDRTGVLGFGNLRGGDKKCFNAVKSWDLGWYAEGHYIVDPFLNSFDGQIVGLANFDQREERYVILKIVGHNDEKDYYVAFNRRDGMNEGSTQHKDRVIITSKKSSDKVGFLSYKEVALYSGEFYTIEKFGGDSSTLFIEVKDISQDSSPAYADISIFLRDDQASKRQVDKMVKKKKKSKKKKKKNKKKEKKANKKRRKLGSAIRILTQMKVNA